MTAITSARELKSLDLVAEILARLDELTVPHNVTRYMTRLARLPESAWAFVCGPHLLLLTISRSFHHGSAYLPHLYQTECLNLLHTIRVKVRKKRPPGPTCKNNVKMEKPGALLHAGLIRKSTQPGLI
jgi:hypothetical protein